MNLWRFFFKFLREVLKKESVRVSAHVNFATVRHSSGFFSSSAHSQNVRTHTATLRQLMRSMAAFRSVWISSIYVCRKIKCVVAFMSRGSEKKRAEHKVVCVCRNKTTTPTFFKEKDICTGWLGDEEAEKSSGKESRRRKCFFSSSGWSGSIRLSVTHLFFYKKTWNRRFW